MNLRWELVHIWKYSGRSTILKNQYFTVPHIVHWTPADNSKRSADVQWTMTRQASPVIVHRTSAERSVDNDQTFAQFCINFNYYYLILSI